MASAIRLTSPRQCLARVWAFFLTNTSPRPLPGAWPPADANLEVPERIAGSGFEVVARPTPPGVPSHRCRRARGER